MNFLKIFFKIFLIFSLHLFALNFFGFPFNRFNIILLYLTWILIADHRRNISVETVLAGFMMETYSGVFFGAHILSLTITVEILKWFLTNIITNRSYAGIFLSIITAMSVHELIFTGFVYVYGFFTRESPIINFNFAAAMAETILVSAAIVVFFYFLSNKILGKLNPAYIKKRQ